MSLEDSILDELSGTPVELILNESSRFTYKKTKSRELSKSITLITLYDIPAPIICSIEEIWVQSTTKLF